MKKKIKGSNDACKAIVDLTQGYGKPDGYPDPEGLLIHQLRNIAAEGVAADKAAEDAEDADLDRLIEKAEKDQGKFPFDDLKLQ